MDYYSILGVDKTASASDIKRAYRKLASTHHPDKGGDAKLFQQIQAAYDILGDPEKRQQYDNPQPQFRFNSTNFNNPGGDPFEQIFAQFRQPPRRPKNRDVHIQYVLDFADQFTGRGITANYKLPSGNTESIDIKIPAGVNHGDVIRLEGYGDNSDNRFPRGDLLLKIKIRNLAGWQRDHLDVITSINVSVFDLLLGTELNVDIPDGKTIKLKIPKGTQPNTTFSIQGYGIQNIKTGKKGSVFVKILGEVPKIDDTSTLEKLTKIKNKIK